MFRAAADNSKHAPNAFPKDVYADLDDLLRTRLFANQLNLQFANPSKSLISGPVHTRFKGRGMEFEEVRVYQPGDDIRTIDWRVTARTQVAHTKLFQEEREKPVLLVVDQRSNMFFGSQRCFKSVYAAHIAATLGWAAIYQNDRVGALVFGDDQQRDVRPKRSKHAQLSFLQQLVEFNHKLISPVPKNHRIAFNEILADVRRVAKPGTNIFILSDFFDLTEDCKKNLYMLSRHNNVSLFHIYDALEQHWPKASQLSVSNGRERIKINASSADFQRRYQANFTARMEQLRAIANRLAVTVVDTCTTEDPDTLLKSLYSRQYKHKR